MPYIFHDVPSEYLYIQKHYYEHNAIGADCLIHCFFQQEQRNSSTYEPIAQVGDFYILKNKDNNFEFIYQIRYLCFCAMIDEQIKKISIIETSKNYVASQKALNEILQFIFAIKCTFISSVLAHAAAVVYDESAVLFCGKSGAGKSTQARLWEQYLHAWTMNYDKPIIKIEKGIFVTGSPWGGKENRCIIASVPLKAILFVNQAEENSVVRLSKADAFSNLYLHYYVFPLNPKVEANYISVIKYISENVPVYLLNCRIDEEAVKVAFEMVYKFDYYQIKEENKCMKYITDNNFILREIAGDSILMPRGKKALEVNAVTVLNETGVLIWKRLMNGASESDLVKAVLKEYAIETKTAQKDVAEYINKLLDEGMISIINK